MNNEKVTYPLSKKYVTGNWESTFISLIKHQIKAKQHDVVNDNH